MSTRREFLKLLGAIPLALGLRWPVAEPESEPIWEGYVERVAVTTRGLRAIRKCDALSYEVWIDDEAWWLYNSDGTAWKSDDMGYNWQQVTPSQEETQ